jgi:hypothetical protein
MIEITIFTKSGGPLTKRILLAPDGSVKNDSAACVMAHGTARRANVASILDLGILIERLKPNEGIALGSLRAGLPDEVEVVTKRKLNCAANVIARTGADLVYCKAQTALALLDYDTKGMPGDIAAALQRCGGYWAALVGVVPALQSAARVIRRSTSAGLYRSDTGAQLPGSDGVHVYVAVEDGADIERFLKTLHERCWLNGFGWMMVGAGGQLLERSIVDRMVYAPERLVFEGGPVLTPPLRQDHNSRKPIAVAGEALDTLTACPPLTVAETSRLQELRAKAAHRLAGEQDKTRRAFIATQAKQLAARKGISVKEAMPTIMRQCEGVLLPDVVLPFDDPELEGRTVADVLADPDRFEGATLADPLEGVDYGTCKAQIMRRADGSMWIHSFAHGRTVYDLKLDAVAVRAILERTDKQAVAQRFIELAMTADLDEGELEYLRCFAAEKSELGRRTINVLLKAARAKKAAQRAQDLRARQLTERLDPRPRIVVPDADQDWLPQIAIINDVLGASSASEPPTRNIDGTVTRVRKLSLPNLHAFARTEADSNDLPAPEQWMLRRMNDMEVAELIEQHIDYVDEDGRSVHLPMPFVRHYVDRNDGVLPTVVAIATLPIILGNGSLLAPDGLDRNHGIVFKIQKELRAVLPQRQDCTAPAIRKAVEFLCHEWLCDVATDYTGKCILIAAALTVSERSLLPDRPAFFVTAGRRGGGKTTTLAMLIKAVTGDWPAAAAWSSNEEERRKALLSYFLSGVGYILWDNIPRGAQIACPHIEKSCTAAYYSDRKLGVSEMVATAASTIHFFTGNNIRPLGDLASRCLNIRLAVDRPDPENRAFEHPDPVGWTEAHRADILRALYTILLGNPVFAKRGGAKAKTRFKTWWYLIGAAIEHGANLIGQQLDFQELFMSQEEDDEDTASLADALAIMQRRWPLFFKANDVADLINRKDADAGLDLKTLHDMNADSVTLRDFLFGQAPAGFVATPKAVGKRLRAHIDEPVKVGEQALVLRRSVDRDSVSNFWVGDPEQSNP